MSRPDSPAHASPVSSLEKEHLNITKDFEHNIDNLVINVLGSKSRHPIDDLSQENKKDMKDINLQAVSLSSIIESFIRNSTKFICCYRLQIFSCECISSLTAT
jgi:hypothetical protein